MPEETSLDPALLRQLSQSLKVGVAVVDPVTWAVVFENAAFFKWFPPEGDDDSLPARIAAFRSETARARLDDGRVYQLETESHESARKVPVAIEARALPGTDPVMMLLECQDTSKQKQAEYMLSSYSEMAEKNARELQHPVGVLDGWFLVEDARHLTERDFKQFVGAVFLWALHARAWM
jgi:adenylate cyclase